MGLRRIYRGVHPKLGDFDASSQPWLGYLGYTNLNVSGYGLKAINLRTGFPKEDQNDYSDYSYAKSRVTSALTKFTKA